MDMPGLHPGSADGERAAPPRLTSQRGASPLRILVALVCLGAGLAVLVQGFRSPGARWLDPTLTFAFLGLLALGLGLRLLLPHGRTRSRRERDLTDEPWNDRPDWAAGEIRGTGRAALARTWTMALFWNALSAPVLVLVPREMEDGNYAALFGLIFPAVGVGLLIWAVRSTLRWRRFGVSMFRMTRVPGVIGGVLRGIIECGLRPARVDRIRLTLTCIHKVVTGHGKNRHTHEKIVWREERMVRAAEVGSGPRGGRVPVDFLIPFDCRETDLQDDRNAVHWMLRAEAQLPGVDYLGEFEVPVFRTAESNEAITESAAGASGFADVVEFPGPRYSPGVRVGPATAGGTEFYFGAARNKKAAISLTAFLSIWTAALAFLLQARIPVIFPIFWGLFEAILLLAALELWFGVSRVIVRDDRLEIRSGLFGLGRRRIFPAAVVSDIQLEIGMQSGQRAGDPYYDLKVYLPEGKCVTAGRHLRSKREAQWLASEMKRTMRLPS